MIQFCLFVLWKLKGNPVVYGLFVVVENGNIMGLFNGIYSEIISQCLIRFPLPELDYFDGPWSYCSDKRLWSNSKALYTNRGNSETYCFESNHVENWPVASVLRCVEWVSHFVQVVPALFCGWPARLSTIRSWIYRFPLDWFHRQM